MEKKMSEHFKELHAELPVLQSAGAQVLAKDKRASRLKSVQKKSRQSTPMEKLEKVREGVSKKELELFKKSTGLDYDTLARGLSAARATLINKKGNQKFNFAVSEKIVGLFDIYSYGYEVFGDKERFNQWMFRSNQAIDNNAPYDLVNNQFGQEEIKNLIGRIDYGVFS